MKNLITRKASNSIAEGSRIKLLFLGQCIAAGFEVMEPNAYPSLTKSLLDARFPTLKVAVDFRPLLHPTGLKALFKASLALKPDIVFVSLPAIFAATTFRLNSLYLLSPEVMNLARAFMRKIENVARKDTKFSRLMEKRAAFVPTVKVPPVGVQQYEQLIEEAVLYFRRHTNGRVILMGPGGFNLGTGEKNELTPELFTAVNEMIMNLGKRLSIPVVNANDLMTDQDGAVYLRDNQRWSAAGHQVMAREIEQVLAEEVLAVMASRTRY